MKPRPILLPLSALLLTMTLLTGCSRNIFSIHRIDIEQGNVIDPAAVAELSEGMNRQQVIALLGQPVLEPVLNPKRWEYVYYRKRPDQPAEQKTVIVHFDGDRVARIEKVH